jgi:hypothetical protein
MPTVVNVIQHPPAMRPKLNWENHLKVFQPPAETPETPDPLDKRWQRVKASMFGIAMGLIVNGILTYLGI